MTRMRTSLLPRMGPQSTPYVARSLSDGRLAGPFNPSMGASPIPEKTRLWDAVLVRSLPGISQAPTHALKPTRVSQSDHR